MATVTGLTAARMLEIEAQSVVHGSVNEDGYLILEHHDESTEVAGYVRGPKGDKGEDGAPSPSYVLPDRLSIRGQLVTDWNNALETGFYYGISAANGPTAFDGGSGSWMSGIVQRFPDSSTGDRIIQRLRENRNGQTSIEYVRYGNQSTGTFGSWEATVGGQAIQSNTVRVLSTSDVSLTSTGHGFQIGPDTGLNLAMDQNEIASRNNGAASGLFINGDGQDLQLGSAASRVNIPDMRRCYAVYRSSGQAIATSSWTTLTWNATRLNEGSIGYSAGVFTMPVDGVYLLNGAYRFPNVASPAGQRTVRFMINGTDSIEGLGYVPVAGISSGASHTLVRPFAAGDTVSMDVWQSQGSSQTTQSGEQYTFFEVTLLYRR